MNYVLAVVALMALAFCLQFARLIREMAESERAWRDEYVGTGERWQHPLPEVNERAMNAYDWWTEEPK